MNENTLIIAIIYIGMTLPLLIMASNKTKPAAIIVAALLLSPLVGWIIYLLLDDAETNQNTKGKSKAAKKLEALNARVYGQRSEDPIEVWEREQRIKQGPPPRPPHIHLE